MRSGLAKKRRLHEYIIYQEVDREMRRKVGKQNEGRYPGSKIWSIEAGLSIGWECQGMGRLDRGQVSSRLHKNTRVMLSLTRAFVLFYHAIISSSSTSFWCKFSGRRPILITYTRFFFRKQVGQIVAQHLYPSNADLEVPSLRICMLL